MSVTVQMVTTLLYHDLDAPVTNLDNGNAACWEAGSYCCLTITADCCASFRAVNAIDTHLLAVIQALNS